MLRLRCVGFADTYRDQPVTEYRVFNPEAASRNGVRIRTSADLEQHPELVQFLGHIDTNGKTYVTDRRTPAVYNKERRNEL